MAAKRSRLSSCCRLSRWLVALWVPAFLYSCLPIRLTSLERVGMEVFYRLVSAPAQILFGPECVYDGTLPWLDAHRLLPKDEPLSKMEIVYNAKEGIPALAAASRKQDRVVIWKGFTNGMLDRLRDQDTFMNFVNHSDTYQVMANRSNFVIEDITMQEAQSHLEDYYLGFCYNFLDNNPALYDQLRATFEQYPDFLPTMDPFKNSKHHTFLYRGDGFSTGMHQEPVGGWFLQISNTKRWRVVDPAYTPYMAPATWDGIAVMSRYDYMPDNASGVPYREFSVEAGDLMYLPPHWWHEVHNMDADTFGWALGLRPIGDAAPGAPRDLLFPHRAAYGVVHHRAMLLSRKILSTLVPSSNKGHNPIDIGTKQKKGVGQSGLAGRKSHAGKDSPAGYVRKQMRKHVPTWDWDRINPKAPPCCEPCCDEQNKKLLKGEDPWASTISTATPLAAAAAEVKSEL